MLPARPTEIRVDAARPTDGNRVDAARPTDGNQSGCVPCNVREAAACMRGDRTLGRDECVQYNAHGPQTYPILCQLRCRKIHFEQPVAHD